MKHLPKVVNPPIQKLTSPIQAFLRIEASGGILLLICTVIALVWANSPWADVYHHLLETKFVVGYGQYVIDKTLLHWINDGLMAIFFFVVGLEIKREILLGELSSVKKAALPIAGAIGGMVVPAGIYAAFNWGDPEAIRGWGVPMATDIAFAIGIMALLGKRVPLALKVFLTAVAIVDDIGAVLVIAIFYTDELKNEALIVAGVVLALLMVVNALGARHPLPYVLLGVVMWVAVLKSGIHATIAGVLIAATIPAKVRLDEQEFEGQVEGYLGKFRDAAGHGDNIVVNERRQSAVHGLEVACEQVQPPLLRLEHDLVSLVAFFVMPVFALANAGIGFGGDTFAAVDWGIVLGVSVGLVVGKILGVTGLVFAAVKAGLGSLPRGVSWKQIVGAASLAGIGFTMSLFIAGLAFTQPASEASAKIGILGGSFVASVIGLALLRSCPMVTAGGAAANPGNHDPSPLRVEDPPR